MAGITLTGMASGLDTDSIISQLMALEQNKVVAVQMRQVKVQAHKDDLSSIKTKLDAFKTAATALSDAATVEGRRRRPPPRTRPSSTSTLLGGAGIGGHTVQIDKLASSAQHGFTYTPSATAGSFDLYYGADRARPAPARSRSTSPPTRPRPTSRRAINANEDAPVYAAVIKDASNNERIVLSARKTGQSSDFTVDTTAHGRRQLAGRGRHVHAHGHHAQRVLQARRRGRPAHRRSPTSSRTRSRASA